MKSLIKKESEDLEAKNQEYNFRLTMAEQLCSSYTSFSRLLGKDLIMPYNEGKSLLEWKNNYENFIIGLDENGENLLAACNEKELSNFFKNRGTPHFLTPVYFKKNVLKKYYDNPSKYSVSSTSINCSGLWLIHIDEYKDLIQVWLGDIGHIPYNEQKHWKQYNVVSDGKITASRFKRDFMAEFCDPEDIMYRFNKEFDELKPQYSTKYLKAIKLILDNLKYEFEFIEISDAFEDENGATIWIPEHDFFKIRIGNKKYAYIYGKHINIREWEDVETNFDEFDYGEVEDGNIIFILNENPYDDDIEDMNESNNKFMVINEKEIIDIFNKDTIKDKIIHEMKKIIDKINWLNIDIIKITKENITIQITDKNNEKISEVDIFYGYFLNSRFHEKTNEEGILVIKKKEDICKIKAKKYGYMPSEVIQFD